MEKNTERIFIANLKDVIRKPVTKRQRRSVELIRSLVARHAKCDISNVRIDNELLEELFKHGGMAPLHKIKVKIFVDDKGMAFALPPEKKAEKPKKAKPAKAAKPAEKKAESKQEKAPEKEQPKPKFEQKNVEQSKPKFEQKAAQLK
jgi:ribosomal protein L31E